MPKKMVMPGYVQIDERIYQSQQFSTYHALYHGKLVGCFATKLGAEAWLEAQSEELDLDK